MAGLTANPKYNQSPIVHQYREGKLKSTLKRELKDLKSNSYRIVTALAMQMDEGCNVRLEERAREFFHVARLTSYREAEAKASVKARQSRGLDLKPDDLFMSKMKSTERWMEV